MRINRKFLIRLTIEASKEEGTNTIDRILKAFLPKDYDTWAVVLPMSLGQKVYQEVYGAVFHDYDLDQPCIEFLEEWFILDDDLHPSEAQWRKVYRYSQSETKREYPPMILKDVTSEVAGWGAKELPYESNL